MEAVRLACVVKCATTGAFIYINRKMGGSLYPVYETERVCVCVWYALERCSTVSQRSLHARSSKHHDAHAMTPARRSCETRDRHQQPFVSGTEPEPSTGQGSGINTGAGSEPEDARMIRAQRLPRHRLPSDQESTGRQAAWAALRAAGHHQMRRGRWLPRSAAAKPSPRE